MYLQHPAPPKTAASSSHVWFTSAPDRPPDLSSPSLSLRRRLRPVRPGPRGGPPGEIPVCFRGVREEPVPQPAKQVWEAAAALAFAPHRLFLCHRAALLRPSGGQNPHRDSDKGHAAVRQQLQLALHAPSVERDATVVRHRRQEKAPHTSRSAHFFSAAQKTPAALRASEAKLPQECDNCFTYT